jgi:hypothetical protein
LKRKGYVTRRRVHRLRRRRVGRPPSFEGFALGVITGLLFGSGLLEALGLDVKPRRRHKGKILPFKKPGAGAGFDCSFGFPPDGPQHSA